MKRICLLLICLFALATQASPQTGPYGGNSDYDIPRTPKDETLPPLPEAVAMRQYTDYPVALNTGAANVQIPVFSLDEGDIPLSVSLSYHSNGCKAEANSGAVGLGWTLQAGGCISRSIMGLPDEYKGIMVEDHTSTKLRLTHLTRVMQKRIDASMDRYYYNFNGYSGCFVRYGGHIIKLPENDLKIEEITGSDSKMPDFRIITPDGTAYYFTEKEYLVRVPLQVLLQQARRGVCQLPGLRHGMAFEQDCRSLRRRHRNLQLPHRPGLDQGRDRTRLLRGA